MDSSSEQDSVDEIERAVSLWRPRAVLRRTNWMYRVDSLRPLDIDHLHLLWDNVIMLREYALQFLIWGSVLSHLKVFGESDYIRGRCSDLLPIILHLSQACVSEGYCCMLDFMRIGYYPSRNRINRSIDGARFPDVQRRRLDEIGNNEAREMTGFSLNQLSCLSLHLRIPTVIRDLGSRRTFDGEEAFLHYMVYNRLGVTKLQMSLYYFGGDPRRFSYSIRAMGRYLYETFYHKISGTSMLQWLDYIDDFRFAIWQKIMQGGTIESSNNKETLVTLDIPMDSFRVFGFLDDTGFRTTAPGISARRRLGFEEDVQRAFYSGYFAAHGIKVQVITLPNGMIGSIFLGSLRVSDSGLLNMSNLNGYLVDMFHENDISLSGDYCPCLYGDGIFPVLPTILPRYSSPNSDEARINTRLSSVRQSIEHIFALHSNVFELFNHPKKFKLLHCGHESVHLIFNSFLLLNCYNCLNRSSSTFVLPSPTLEEYLPLDEVLEHHPIVTDEDLGEVYRFT